MFGPGRATYDGEYASVGGAVNVPKGLQSPRIPIIVGGNGAQASRAGYAIQLRRRAQLRVPVGPDEIAERIADVRARCEDGGSRPGDPAHLAVHARRGASASRVRPRVDLLAALAATRADRVICFPTRWSPTLEAQAVRRGLPGRRGLELDEPPGSAPAEPARGIRPSRRSGAYRNQARPTSSSSGTGPYWRESIGLAEAGRGRVSSAVASLSSHASSSAELEIAVGERDPVAGPAATRLTASVSSSGSRKTTIVPRRGQRVDRRVDEQPVARRRSPAPCWPRPTATRHGPRRRARAAASSDAGVGRGSGRPVRAGRYFLVAQKISPNSLTAASSWAAASASTLCLFLLASLRMLPDLVVEVGIGRRGARA